MTHAEIKQLKNLPHAGEIPRVLFCAPAPARSPDTVLDEIDRRIDALAEEFLCGKEEKMKE